MITAMKNKYINCFKISEAKFKEIVQYVCLDIKATKLAKLSKISRQSINKIIKNIRILISKECAKKSKRRD